MGTLEVGKIANMTILDTDLVHCDIEKVPYAQIVATIVDGIEVYTMPDNPDYNEIKKQYEEFITELLYQEKYD